MIRGRLIVIFGVVLFCWTSAKTI